MYIAIREKGTDIILDDTNINASDYADFETLEEALEQMNKDVDDYEKFAHETFVNYYIQVID